MTDDPADTKSKHAALSSRWRLAAAVVFSALYLAMLSVTSLPTVFPANKAARLAGADAHYHLRHSEAVVANYPRILRPDPGTNFPHGEVGLNQGGFDLAVATVSKLSFGLLSPKIILIFISPLCALTACLWIAHWLARESSDLTAGLFLLFALAYPGSLNTVAALGQGDHHAFEVLMAVIIAWSLSWLFRTETSWGKAPLAALPLVFLYFSWAGSVLQFLLAILVFYFRAWNPEVVDPHLARKGALYGATVAATVGIANLVLPWTTLWSTSYKLTLLGAVVLTLAYPLLVALAKKLRKAPAIGAVSLLALGFSAAFMHPVLRGYLNLMTEERSSAISEHGLITLGLLYRFFGPLAILALLGLVVLVWRRKLWWASVPLIYAGGLVLFWLATKDFIYYSPLPVAAAAAYGLSAWRRPRPTLLVGLVLAVLPLVPPVGVQSPWMSYDTARETMLVTDALESASGWLKENYESRESGAGDYGLVAPWDLGNILAQTTATPVGWSQTHSPLLAQILVADRPDAVYKFLTEGEKPFRYIYLPARNLAEKYITELGVAGLPVSAEFTMDLSVSSNGKPLMVLKTLPRHDLSLMNRLYWKKGQDLGHFRLVFETSEQSLHTQKLMPEVNSVQLHSRSVDAKALAALQPLLDFPGVPLETNLGLMWGARLAPEVRIFEIVKGAVVSGEAPPKSRVTAELELFSPTSKKSWTNSWSTTADAQGKWSLRLPYPTDVAVSPVAGSVVARGAYRLTIGKQLLTFSLSEAMIADGSAMNIDEKNL